jgi:hypothetical protein
LGWILPSFQKNLNSLSMLVISLKITHINHIFTIFQLSFTVIFTIDKAAIVNKSPFFAATA